MRRSRHQSRQTQTIRVDNGTVMLSRARRKLRLTVIAEVVGAEIRKATVCLDERAVEFLLKDIAKLTSSVPTAVEERRLVTEGSLIGAIKNYRARTGADLKDAIDAMRRLRERIERTKKPKKGGT